MSDRIESFFYRRPGSKFLVTLLGIALVRAVVVWKTENYYWPLWGREVTPFEERVWYYGVLLYFLLMFWALNWLEKPIYLVWLCILPAIMCYLFRHFYPEHWTVQTPHRLLMIVLVYIGIRAGSTLVYDIRNRKMTHNLWRKVGELFYKGVLGIICIMALSIGIVGQIKPELLTYEGVAAASAEVPDTPEEQKRQRWLDNQDKMALLNDDIFSELTLEEKLKALRFVLEVELEYLGCDADKITLEAGDTWKSSVYGYYDEVTSTICIREEVLANHPVEDCIEVIMHECYHVYQFRCMSYMEKQKTDSTNLLMFREIEQWKAECANYVRCEDEGNYMAYRSQSLESKAFDYASKWSYEIYWYIPRKAYIEEATGEIIIPQ